MFFSLKELYKINLITRISFELLWIQFIYALIMSISYVRKLICKSRQLYFLYSLFNWRTLKLLLLLFSAISFKENSFLKGICVTRSCIIFRTDERTPRGSPTVVNECSTVIACRIWRQMAGFFLFSVENKDLGFILKNKLLVSNWLVFVWKRPLIAWLRTVR